MSCPACGSAVPEGIDRCPTCGAPVTGDQAPRPPTSSGSGGWPSATGGQEGSAGGWANPASGRWNEPGGDGGGGGGWGGSPSGWPPQRPPSGPSDTQTWSVLAHLSALATFLVPLGNIVAPLAIWLIRRDQDPVSAEHARNALNFQISWTIWFLLAALLVLVLVGLLLVVVLGIAWLVLVVSASVKASRGEQVAYPMTITFVR